MNSPLTRLAAKALQFAEEEATALGQKTASAHILLGILRVGQGVAWTVLSAYGVTLDGRQGAGGHGQYAMALSASFLKCYGTWTDSAEPESDRFI